MKQSREDCSVYMEKELKLLLGSIRRKNVHHLAMRFYKNKQMTKIWRVESVDTDKKRKSYMRANLRASRQTCAGSKHGIGASLANS